MATLSEQLDAMLGLRPNWDGYDADPPLPDAVKLAKELVAWFEFVEEATGVGRNIRVHPTRVGGVLIEWEDARYEHELEVYPGGRLELLHEDKRTGEMTEREFVPTEQVLDPAALASLRVAFAA